MRGEHDSEFVYPYQHIFEEASERGIDANKVQKLLNEREKKHIGSPETLDDLLDRLSER